MIWKLEDDKAEPILAMRTLFTAIGTVNIYAQSNQVLLETNDMAQMGLFREKLINEVLPEVYKILGKPYVDIERLKLQTLQKE